jgi:hypothetical protein
MLTISQSSRSLGSTAAADYASSSTSHSEILDLDESTQKAYRMAIQLLREIQALNIRTQEDFFPCTELYSMPSTELDSLYKTHGENFLNCCEFQLKLGLVRAAVRKVNTIFGPFLESPLHTQVAISIATAKANVSACGELSDLAFTLGLKNEFNIRIITLNGKTSITHALVLIGAEPLSFKEFDKINFTSPQVFLKVINTLEGVVIFDPYLKRIIPAERAEKDSCFVASLAAMDAVTIEYMIRSSENAKHNAITLFESAEKIHQCMISHGFLQESALDGLRENLRELESEHMINIYEFMVQKRRKQISDRLSQLHPDTTGQWKYKRPTVTKPSHSIWLTTSKETAEAMTKQLSEYGITSSQGKIAGKDSHLLTLPVADFGLHTIWEKLNPSIAAEVNPVTSETISVEPAA